MDIFDSLLKGDLVEIIDVVKSDINTTKALIIIQVKDDKTINTIVAGINEFEVIGIIELAKIQVIDNGVDE